MSQEMNICNIDLLKSKLIDKNITISILADKMEVDRSSLYRKFNNGFETTYVKEVRKIVSILGLTNEEAFEIFGIRCQTTCKKITPNQSYPNKYMGITELAEYTGLPKDYFKSIARAKDAPIVRTNGGGKIYFKTDELNAYMQKVTEARRYKGGRF